MAFLRKKPKKLEGNAAVQTTRRLEHPFSALDRYCPLGDPELKIYESIREAIPVVDSAICKIVRLTGGFRVICDDEPTQRLLDRFLKTVRVGPCLRGIDSFLDAFFDQLLMYGTAVGEMIINSDGELAALYNADLKDVELRLGSSPLETQVWAWGEDHVCAPVPFQDRVLISSLNPSPGKIKGNSLLKGLPFVSTVLLKIFNTIGTNWERMGNLRFAVTYRPSENGFDAITASDRAGDIAKEWSKAMSDDGTVRDFVGVGDIDIKVIGADNQIMDSSVPVRQMMEQIVAKTGLPPFMLGLAWSTTERMSSQQADILTSELESYRRLLEPVVSQIVSRYLATIGSDSDFEVVWNNINLQDETELAKAALIRAQTRQIEEKLGGSNI